MGKHAWLLVAFSCGTVHAQAAEPAGAISVLVRVCGERDRLALERVRGQTSDLPVTVLAREDGPLEPSFERQLERAEQLAAEQRASAVVWFAERSAPAGGEPGGWVVYVATPGDGRVLTHRLPPSAQTTALLEQSALIVRFAVLSIGKGTRPSRPIGKAAGAPPGVTIGKDTRPSRPAGGAVGAPPIRGVAAPSRSSSTREAATALPAAETREVVGAASRGSSAEGVATAIPAAEADEPVGAGNASGEDAALGGGQGLWLALGYELTADGFAAAGEHALWARASAGLGRWEAGLVASAGLPAEREAEPAGMRLQRVRLGALLGARVALAGSWSLAAGAQAGALLQRRETIGAADNATARGARWNAALVLGPEASVHMRSAPWGLALGAALDVLPSPTRFALRAGEDELDVAQPARVQPRLFVAAELAP